MQKKLFSIKRILVTLLVFYGGFLSAVDNPDAPDLVGPFEKLSQPFEKANGELTGGSAAAASFAKYEAFLDAQLNKVHRGLIRSLSKPDQEKLKKAQRNWLPFRDAEFEFMKSKWAVETTGTAWTLAVGSARTNLIKKRVIELLRYCEQTNGCQP